MYPCVVVLVLIYGNISTSLRDVTEISNCIQNIGDDFSPLICQSFCASLKACRCPAIKFSSLACHIAHNNKRSSETEDAKGQLHKTKVIILKECDDVQASNQNHQRIFDSLLDESNGVDKRQEPNAFLSDITRPRTTQEAGTFHTTDKSREGDNFDLEISSQLQTDGVTISSMSISRSYQNLIYLLVDLPKSKCKPNLYFADSSTHRLQSNVVPLCDSIRAYTRQIFSGPCVRQKTDICLYSLVLGRNRFILSTYKEPSPGATGFVRDNKGNTRWKRNPVCCFVYGEVGIFCLSSSQLYHFKFYRLSRIRLRQLPGQRYSFGLVTDVKLDYTVSKSHLIICGDHVVLAEFNYDVGTVKTVTEIATECSMSAWVNGTILLHNEFLASSFYICSKDSFETCSAVTQDVDDF